MKLLVAEWDPSYRELISLILKDEGIDFEICSDENEFLKLLSDEIDVVLLDTKFIIFSKNDLIKIINEDFKKPFILITADDLFIHFDLILYKKITHVLKKPLKTSELLRVLDKIINPTRERCFGLKKYLNNMKNSEKMILTSSRKMGETVEKILDNFKKWGFNPAYKKSLILVWKEMIINAMYHSYGYSDLKLKAEHIKLTGDERVEIGCAHNGEEYGVSVRDFCGTLTKEKILSSLFKVFEQKEILERADESGDDVTDLIHEHGRGLDLLGKLTGEYYINIEPNVSSEIIILYDGSIFDSDASRTCINIFQI